MKRLAILVSGNGTNMENILERIRKKEIPAEASLIVSDNSQAYALKRAENTMWNALWWTASEPIQRLRLNPRSGAI